MTTVLTVGHGTLSAEAFVELLQGAGVAHLVDVRSYPGSRHNPQFGREAMEQWLPEAGIAYSWKRDLGGRRRPIPDTKHRALRVAAFGAYADHMETPAFQAAVGQLLGVAARSRTAVMCSESVWWRCHRRLLADHVTLVRSVEVLHLMHDGRLQPHPITDGARLDDGTVVYDVGTTAPLPETS